MEADVGDDGCFYGSQVLYSDVPYCKLQITLMCSSDKTSAVNFRFTAVNCFLAEHICKVLHDTFYNGDAPIAYISD